LCSDDFKERAVADFVFEHTSLGQEVEARKKEHWQWWKGDERGKQLQHLVHRVPKVWEEEGWVAFETTYDGRPRTVEYNSATLSRAHSLYRDGHQFETPDSSYNWARSVLGETVRTHYRYVVVLSTAVYREWFDEVGAETVEGKTRGELAELLGVSKGLANSLVRWLVSTGTWELRKNNSRRELRRVNP
jgi:transposase